MYFPLLFLFLLLPGCFRRLPTPLTMKTGYYPTDLIQTRRFSSDCLSSLLENNYWRYIWVFELFACIQKYFILYVRSVWFPFSVDCSTEFYVRCCVDQFTDVIVTFGSCPTVRSGGITWPWVSPYMTLRHWRWGWISQSDCVLTYYPAWIKVQWLIYAQHFSYCWPCVEVSTWYTDLK